MTNLEKFKDDIKALIEKGDDLFKTLKGDNSDLIIFRSGYEIWYSESLSVIKIILPNRLEDFSKYYNDKNDSLKKAINFTPPKSEGIELINNWSPTPANQADIAKSLFQNQLNILKACEKTFESSLFDIKEILRADIFDSELEAATHLNNNGFFRCAGAIAGVVLENHLQNVCDKHLIKITKKDPSINELNLLLKNNSIIDMSIFKKIQFLADIRNKCDHKKETDPKKEEVEDLISGVNNIIKNVF